METTSLTDFKANPSKILDRVEQQHERIYITRNGHDAAVLMSADEYESLIETLEVAAFPGIREHLAQSVAEHDEGQSFDEDQTRLALGLRSRIRKA